MLSVQSTQSKRRGGSGADEDETLTPTLPGMGRCRDQARYEDFGVVTVVAGGATVVTVVVRTVVNQLPPRQTGNVAPGYGFGLAVRWVPVQIHRCFAR
jgi:hypothetical protein